LAFKRHLINALEPLLRRWACPEVVRAGRVFGYTAMIMEAAVDYVLTSTVPGVKWPGIPSPEGAALLAVHHQLDQSQWWPREKLEARQFDQLREILAHAAQTAPFHRERLIAAGIDPARAIAPAAFARLPLLTSARDTDARCGAAVVSTATRTRPAGRTPDQRVDRRALAGVRYPGRLDVLAGADTARPFVAPPRLRRQAVRDPQPYQR
jgi:hypothetical protein